MLEERFSAFVNDAIRQYWNQPALSDYAGDTQTFGEIASRIRKIHQFMSASGIKQGDKIALVGKNSAQWCVIYLAVTTYGAVIVPILPDFREEDLHGIIHHSDSRLLFAGDPVMGTIDLSKLPLIEGLIHLETMAGTWFRSAEIETIWHDSARSAPIASASDYHPEEIPNDRLAVISYTSGTTGNAKGVMLTHNALAANIRYGQRHMPLHSGDPIVSFLPLAHTFGCAFEFLFPFSLGCHVTILTKTPSPQIIMKAFQEIRPALILSVPLVIEKIFKKQLLPVISKPLMRVLIATPVVNKLILKKINKKLTNVFGGRFKEIVIGGAPLNYQAERFFKKMSFPYTVGYGMTECGPLISYADWQSIPLQSSGRVIDTLELTIDSPDPYNTVGEIMLKGENIMLGYYKNPEATEEVLDSEGWLHTGDLGILNRDGFLFIKGRSKSMFLGADGKNIYPESVESVFNNKPGVGESLLVQRGDKLVVLIYPDPDYLQKHHLKEDSIKALFEEYRRTVNHHLPVHVHVNGVEVQKEEFQKTPKRSIRRFLYQ